MFEGPQVSKHSRYPDIHFSCSFFSLRISWWFSPSYYYRKFLSSSKDHDVYRFYLPQPRILIRLPNKLLLFNLFFILFKISYTSYFFCFEIHTHTHTHTYMSFSGGSVVKKKSACQCRRNRVHPWVGKIPWRRQWQPIALFLLGKSYGQRSLVVHSS